MVKTGKSESEKLRLYFKHLFVSDFFASITLFLVSIPMCLGVALACGLPLISGLISGIIGGILVGLLSNSHTSVSGPTPSVIGVTIAAIASLGSYEVFLVAVCIAGLIQIVMSFARCGILGDLIPSSVLRGLLGAVGIIIILKQLPYLVGYTSDAEGSFAFFQKNGENTFSAIGHILPNIHFGSLFIGVVTIVCILLWKHVKSRKLRKFGFITILIPSAIAIYFTEELDMLERHFVQIPLNINISNISNFIIRPDFNALGSVNVYIAAIIIAGVVSIETLLNVESADKLDHSKRRTDPNRELAAQGVGNIVSGIIGGLPVSSVILRTAVNINSGARTKMSTILHGLFLCICIFIAPWLLNSIPLSVLAAVLIVNGMRLIHFSVLREMYARGLSQFLPFIVTLLAIVFTDLIIGVVIGLLVGIFFILKSSYKNPFTISKEKYHVEESIRIDLPQQVSFLNKSSIVKFLYSLPNNTKVTIDARKSDYIDYDIIELIREFKLIHAPIKNIKINTFGFKKHSKTHHIADRIQFSNIITKEIQEMLAPIDILDILKRGNKRFVHNDRISRELIKDAKHSSEFQHPMAVILGCIDSRTSSEMIFDLGFGDAFSIRIAGNVVNDDILGSIEYACKFARAKLVVVLGHTNCGAIRSACDGVSMGNISGMLEKISPAIHVSRHNTENITEEGFMHNVMLANIENSKKQIVASSTIVSDLIETGEIMIVGAMYDVSSGKVVFDV